MNKKQPKIETLRHSLAHIMAAAVQELYPKTKFGIGPAIEDGFYYDFDFSEVKIVNPKSKILNPKQISKSKIPNSKQEFKLTSDELAGIERKMREIIKKDLPFKKKLVSQQEALKSFKDQSYKIELIKELAKLGSNISIYQVGNFVDLCKGPHLKSTKQIPLDGFKLIKVAGAYWRGDEKNKMLTRIYGAAFWSKKELEQYLKRIEEAEKRDHRAVGKKLELFMFDQEVGAGLPLWLPKGAILRRLIESYLYQNLNQAGYQWIVSPHIANIEVWKTSGHWGFYRENMYSPIDIDQEQYLLKPMNCPFHIKVYNSQIRSYKDLPIRFAELGTVYRYEKSGVLHGLTRVRGFTQDDAHICCSPDQLSKELLSTLKLGIKMLKDFGFKKYDIYLSTRPSKYVGAQKFWQKATNALKYALSQMKLDYKIDAGGGVFYGPKIDIKIKDNLGRSWQCTTIQVDFNLPQRFKMFFVNQKGKKQEPILIHRALLGSLERFIGVLIEQYAGGFPVWLAPTQVWIVPVAQRHQKYAQKIKKELSSLEKELSSFHSLRVELKDENETVSKRIRDGEIQKIPYILVVGDKETKNRTVRLRARKKGDVGEIPLTVFINRINLDINRKK